jgi:hypothetical protein
MINSLQKEFTLTRTTGYLIIHVSSARVTVQSRQSVLVITTWIFLWNDLYIIFQVFIMRVLDVILAHD